MSVSLKVAAYCLLLLVASSGVAADLKPWTDGPPPVLDLKDLEGRLHRLADYRGNVVVINFWATWCEPCREEMPSMQRLKDKLARRPFVVLAVNLGEPEARIRKFLTEMRLELPVLLDPDMQAAKAWNARILPASFIVGRDGTIRYRVVGELDWGSDRVVAAIADLITAK